MSNVPIIMLAYANDRRPSDQGSYLYHLGLEVNGVSNVLYQANQKGWCRIRSIPYATLDRVKVELYRQPRAVSVFHYGGHSDQETVFLEGSEMSNHEVDFAQFCNWLGKMANLKLVFLNSCISQEQLPILKEAGIPNLIYTTSFIPDKMAAEFSIEFYRGIAHGCSVREAFEQAKGFLKAKCKEEEQHRTLKSFHAQNELRKGQFPWQLYTSPTLADSGTWNLPESANKRRQTLPAIPAEITQPDNPFKGLQPYCREDARIFFGRENELLHLYECITGEDNGPVTILYGGVATGKTSLVEAGLRPHLEQKFDWIPIEVLMDEASKLLTASVQDTDSETLATALYNSLRQRDTDTFQPIIVIDHYERYIEGVRVMEDIFLSVLSLLVHKGQSLKLKFLLVIQTESKPKIDRYLRQANTHYSIVYLPKPGEDDLEKYAQGIATFFEPNSPASKKNILVLIRLLIRRLQNRKTLVMLPILQILTEKAWDFACRTARYDQTIVDEIELDDLLEEFLTNQVDEIYQLTPFKKFRDSGLVENILGEYVSPWGNIQAISRDEVISQFDSKLKTHVADIISNLRGQARLLVDHRGIDGSIKNQLAHEVLGSLVLKILMRSDSPGVISRRILKQISGPADRLSVEQLERYKNGADFAPSPDNISQSVLVKSLQERQKEIFQQTIRRWARKSKIGLLVLIGAIIFGFQPGQLPPYALTYLIAILLLYRIE